MREVIFLLLLSLVLSEVSARYARKGKGSGESGSKESGSGEGGSEESGESGSNESSGESGGESSIVIKIDFEDTMLKCAANTNLENRLKIAFTTCSEFGKNPISNASVRKVAKKSKKSKGGKRGKNGRKGKKGKGKSGKGKKCKKGKCGGGSNCPSIGEWLEKVNKRSLKDNCMYKTLGWIDDDNELINTQIFADAASLSVSVLADFTDVAMQQCTDALVEKWQSRPKRKRCGESLTSSDNSLLLAAELVAARKKCVKTVLKESCYTAISASLLVETSGSPMPSNPLPAEDGNYHYDVMPIEPGQGAGGFAPVDPLPGWISPPGYGYDHYPGHIPHHEIHIVHHIEYPEHEGYGHGHGIIQSLLPNWPENVVAAIAPAEWVSNNFQFSQISSDSNEDDYYYYDDDYYNYDEDEDDDEDTDENNDEGDDENVGGSEAEEDASNAVEEDVSGSEAE